MEYTGHLLPIGLLILSGMSNLVIGIFTYLFSYKLSKGKHVGAKYFSYICIGIFSWCLWLILRMTYFDTLDNIWGVYVSNVCIYISIISTLQSLVFFGVSFHNDTYRGKYYRFLFYPYIVALIIILIPQVGILQLDINNPIAYNSLAYYVLTVYLVTYSFISIILLLYRYSRVHNNDSKKHIQFILGGAILPLILYGITDIIIPIVGNTMQPIYYAPISTILLSLLTILLMIRYKLFHIELSITGLLITLIVTVSLLLLRFSLINNIQEKYLYTNLSMVLMFGFLYIFLTKEAYIGAHRQLILDSKKKELEIALKSKNDFLKNASHQLRTPLTVIQGYLDMMINRDDPKYQLNKMAMNDLRKTYISAQNLNEIINDVLAANDVNAGRFGVNIKDTVDLQELINSIITEKHELLMTKSTKVKFRVKGLGTQAFVDKAKLKESLNNIIDNAIFYGKGKVIITLETTAKEYFNILIEDNGVGITKEDSKKIWKKFERGKKSALINPNGSGLGLYLAKQILLKHGGDIEAHSDGRDKGSVFIFTLPKDTLTHAPAESFGINIA